MTEKFDGAIMLLSGDDDARRRHSLLCADGSAIRVPTWPTSDRDWITFRSTSGALFISVGYIYTP